MTDALTNRVERCFNKLECSRRLATRYDKTGGAQTVQDIAARFPFLLPYSPQWKWPSQS